ncbi:MAG: hypothetical protein QM831_05320 [Kofleriaceae bacterium]
MADVLMLPTLLEDIAHGRAHVTWIGGTDDTHFDDWLAHNPWLIDASTELLEFWRVTGGGTIRGDSMFGPTTIKAEADTLYARGLDRSLIPFHHNADFISAYNASDDEYVLLDANTRHVEARFATLDDWYIELATTKAS